MSDNGGPAFPPHWNIGYEEQFWHPPLPYQGMSLRDYFAAKAMQGIIAASGHLGPVNFVESVVADNAYLMADAMLAERAKEKP